MKVYNILTKVYCTTDNKSGFIPLDECLKLIASNGPIDVFIETASFSVFENQTPILNEMDWGNLDILIAEMEETIRRIKEGQPGIIRHASMEGDIGMYLLFIPEGNSIRFFLLEIEDPHEMHMCFPIPGYAGSPEQIYNFVEKWLKGAVNDEMVRKSKRMDELTIPATDLITIFKTQIAVGLELLNKVTPK